MLINDGTPSSVGCPLTLTLLASKFAHQIGIAVGDVGRELLAVAERAAYLVALDHDGLDSAVLDVLRKFRVGQGLRIGMRGSCPGTC